MFMLFIKQSVAAYIAASFGHQASARAATLKIMAACATRNTTTFAYSYTYLLAWRGGNKSVRGGSGSVIVR